MNPLKNITPVFLLTVACFALSHTVQAAPQVAPGPDGCYPNYTTAEGCNALSLLTTGAGNTGLGWYALFSAGASNFNTGVGGGALALNTADSNTALGAGAMLLNTVGEMNVAVGTDALVFNNSGSQNNAVGYFALFNNTTGSFNNAHGREALYANVDGIENNAFGDLALNVNTSGSKNTAVGDNALALCTTGSFNVAVGKDAGSNVVAGDNNIYIGAGAQGPGDEIRFLRIGNTSFTDYDCFIVGIKGREVSGPSAQLVYVDANQKIGTELVNTDGTTVPFKPQAMLDESLKQQKRITELEATVQRQQKGMELLMAQLKEQAAQIQRVSARLEMSKPASKVVVNKP
jgi:hypothetical protein